MLALGGVRGHLDRARALRPDGPHKPAIVMATYVVVLFSGTVVVGQRRRKRGKFPWPESSENWRRFSLPTLSATPA